MNVRLYVWQRATAAVMAPLVLGHIAVIFYATRQSLTAADILSRTHGSVLWASYYGLFVAAASIHASIGVRNVLSGMVAIIRPRRWLIRDHTRIAFGGARFSCRRRAGAHVTARALARRGSALWIAAMIHRISGMALAIFLPIHFFVLGLSFHRGARLDTFLRWSDQPLVKFAEGGLVFLLTVHLLGGLTRPGHRELRLARRPETTGDACRCGLGPRRIYFSRADVLGDRMNVAHLKTDILILGSGGAGLFAALHALKANPDLDITVASKGLLGKCGCTRMVQGGYNVALNPGDSIERHFMDTIEGGKWLPHQELAWTLVTTAVERVRELENEIGCFFDRNPDGTLHGKAFAGQTFDRTVHKGDLTGIEIINRLMEQVWARPIRRLEEHRAVALIPTPDGALAGVLMIDVRTGEFRFVSAQAVLLATGGGPTMYRYHTPSGDKTHGRPRHGAPPRPAVARHGDGAVPSDRTSRRDRTRA